MTPEAALYLLGYIAAILIALLAIDLVSEDGIVSWFLERLEGDTDAN